MSNRSVTRYSRQDVLRILRIRAPQLRAWERQGLIPVSSEYTFQDLVQLRKLCQLAAMRLSAASIRAGVCAMRAVSGMTNPLLEAGAMRSGSRVVFRYLGHAMEPIAQQYVFDFDAGREHRLTEVDAAPMTQGQLDHRINALFLEAVHCEENAKTSDAVRRYEEILLNHPGHAPAAINLGTIFYGPWPEACSPGARARPRMRTRPFPRCCWRRAQRFAPTPNSARQDLMRQKLIRQDLIR